MVRQDSSINSTTHVLVYPLLISVKVRPIIYLSWCPFLFCFSPSRLIGTTQGCDASSKLYIFLYNNWHASDCTWLLWLLIGSFLLPSWNNCPIHRGFQEDRYSSKFCANQITSPNYIWRDTEHTIQSQTVSNNNSTRNILHHYHASCRWTSLFTRSFVWTRPRDYIIPSNLITLMFLPLLYYFLFVIAYSRSVSFLTAVVFTIARLFLLRV